MGGTIAIVILAIIILIILVKNIRIVQQARAFVIERLGAYSTTWGVGLHFKVPFIERVAKGVSLKEQVVDFAPQPVITKDNVTMQIDTVLYFEITDPKLYTYGVEQPLTAIENLTATTLRNIIGDLELDQTLTSRDIINSKMRVILDEATDPWGIRINRVELKNILPPKEIQNAMEKQMKAERERREAILRAEGEKKSAILLAEGERESAVLRADAKKQAQILEAEGQAEAILKVQQATAEGIKLINAAGASEEVIKLKSLEAFTAAANGKATKIIIPSELQGFAGLASGIFMNAVHIYSMDTYDASEIEGLAEGDTVVVEGQEIPVKTMEIWDDLVVVNGGIDAEDGCAFTKTEDGDAYRVNLDDDLATYTELGVTSLPVDPAATYYDDWDIESDPVTTDYDGILSAIQTSENDSFNRYNTTLTLQNGRVIELRRVYMP